MLAPVPTRPAADRADPCGRLLPILAGVLILKVTAGIVANYAGYFPPDFRVDFLRGRGPYFFGPYRWAFYAHILAGPATLVLGLILLAASARRRFPAAHRVLGRAQVLLVVLVVAPSGLALATRAAAGPVAGVGLGLLALLTAASAVAGFWAALRGRPAAHRRWMARCYLLLASAVVLRLTVGLATVVGFTPPWLDPLATWMSWLVPLAIFEGLGRVGRSPLGVGSAGARDQGRLADRRQRRGGLEELDGAVEAGDVPAPVVRVPGLEVDPPQPGGVGVERGHPGDGVGRVGFDHGERRRRVARDLGA